MVARGKTMEQPAKPPMSKTDTPMDYKALLKPSAGLPAVTRGREGGENPLAGVVAKGSALMLAVKDSEQAKTITGYLRRDASERGLGVRIVYKNAKGEWVKTTRTKVGDKEVTVYPAGITEVHFEGKDKNARGYTVKDIKAWHKSQTGTDITGPVPSAIRDAYRKAHGHAKDTKST